jgi:hypothetical protein
MFANNAKVVMQQLIGYILNYSKNHELFFTEVTNDYNKNPYVCNNAKVVKHQFILLKF